MPSDQTGVKRRGRPVNPDSKRQTGSNFTFRARPEMRERLLAAASAAGRSASEEIEARLDTSFQMAALYRMFLARGPDGALFHALDKVTKAIQVTALNFGYSESQTREAISAGIDVVKSVHLWTPDSILPVDPPGEQKGVELTPAELGHRSAYATLLFAGDEMIDSLDITPLSSRWTQGRTEYGPSKHASADPATGVRQGQQPLTEIMKR